MDSSRRVLVLGAGGMLGHMVCRVFEPHHEVFGTVRGGVESLAEAGVLDRGRLRAGVEVTRFDSVVGVVAEVRPDVVINCIGIIKQAREAKDPLLSLEVNALFPLRLAQLARAAGARLVHVSTDCVFSGRRGQYRESDTPDAEELYGRSKLLGEVHDKGCLTVRTSIIGRELRGRRGLLEWFLGSSGKRVPGYLHAIFTGFTTLALARILRDVVERHPDLAGLYHVASEPISKYELLGKLRESFQLDVEIVPETAFHCDRSLRSDRFRAATGFVPPSWDEMVEEIATQDADYLLLETPRQGR